MVASSPESRPSGRGCGLVLEESGISSSGWFEDEGEQVVAWCVHQIRQRHQGIGGEVCVCRGIGGGFACQEVANRLYEFDGKAGVNVGHWWDTQGGSWRAARMSAAKCMMANFLKISKDAELKSAPPNEYLSKYPKE